MSVLDRPSSKSFSLERGVIYGGCGNGALRAVTPNPQTLHPHSNTPLPHPAYPIHTHYSSNAALKRETRNPERETQNPKPGTRNLKPTGMRPAVDQTLGQVADRLYTVYP